jgi:signal transduction histidine kinase/CheY-like chemotaxis protein
MLKTDSEISKDTKYGNMSRKILFTKKWKSFAILITGIVLTIAATIYTKKDSETIAKREFALVCNEITTRISIRLSSHAQLLRSGASLFAASDSVTRKDWKIYNESSKSDENLPGIQGVGFSVIIKKEQLQQHIQQIRKEGFPEYTVRPEGDREIYTPIIYLEPFADRNLRAFGYDMYSEPIRRKAMEHACDYDIASLSGKVVLVQETDQDLQAGTLMYVPVYQKEMPTNTTEERRRALLGWVYSPYRMVDLMQGILGRRDLNDKNKIHLQIYDDDSISRNTLLFDSQSKDTMDRTDNSVETLTIPIIFNGKKWTLHFSKPNGPFAYFESKVLVVLLSGFIISLLLFSLSLSLLNTRFRAQQIKESEIKLRELNATKDKFFSIIGHDLKSPFNSVIGFSNLLVERIKNKDIEGIDEYANIVLKSSNKAMDLLQNLMEWSRSQTGRMEFNPEYIDLVSSINKIILLYVDIARQKSITIKNILPQKAYVFADNAMISTVLRNLISNAIKFTMPGGKIIVSAIEKQDEILFSVSDNGVGISKNSIEKLFRIDQSYSTTGTNKETGTGLGLILCKEFVEKNLGKIWVESEEKKGSTFYFTLPYNAEQQEKNVIANAGLAATENQDNSAVLGLKILIAEDDKTSEMFLDIAVKTFCKEILKVRTGVEAVEICRDNPDIDLILMDIQMPEMSGYEATRQIRQFNKEVVIIAQTALVLSGAKEKSIESGCNDYIAKPINKVELLSLIQKYFNK